MKVGTYISKDRPWGVIILSLNPLKWKYTDRDIVVTGANSVIMRIKEEKRNRYGELYWRLDKTRDTPLWKVLNED